jgi:hypothetical protein
MAVEQLHDPVREFLARSLSGLHPASFVRTLGTNMKKGRGLFVGVLRGILVLLGSPIKATRRRSGHGMHGAEL